MSASWLAGDTCPGLSAGDTAGDLSSRPASRGVASVEIFDTGTGEANDMVDAAAGFFANVFFGAKKSRRCGFFFAADCISMSPRLRRVPETSRAACGGSQHNLLVGTRGQGHLQVNLSTSISVTVLTASTLATVGRFNFKRVFLKFP